MCTPPCAIFTSCKTGAKVSLVQQQFYLTKPSRIRAKKLIGTEIRAEAYNILNRAKFAAPHTTETNSQFGQITAQSNRPRMMMFGASITF